MDELRVEIRLRNNVLYQNILNRYPSVKAFCREAGFQPSVVGNYLNLKVNPLKASGYRDCPLQMAKHFHCLVEDLFPLELYDLKETVVVGTVSVEALSLEDFPQLCIPDHTAEIDRHLLSERLEALLNELPRREASILRRRYGLGGHPVETLKEIAKTIGVSKERVRQLEGKGLRRMQIPRRVKEIKDFIGEDV